MPSEKNELGVEVLQLRQAVEVDIAGGRANTGFEGLRGLVSGSGAEIEERLSGCELKQRHDGLRADVLRAPAAHALFGFHERRGAGNTFGGLRAVLPSPSGRAAIRGTIARPRD